LRIHLICLLKIAPAPAEEHCLLYLHRPAPAPVESLDQKIKFSIKKIIMIIIKKNKNKNNKFWTVLIGQNHPKFSRWFCPNCLELLMDGLGKTI
jgi:hypothetical protein